MSKRLIESIHEQCEDLHDVVQPGISSTPVSQRTDQSLCNDGADFTRSGTDAMSGWAIPCWEHLPRNDESSSIGTKICEKIAQTIERKQSACGDLVEAEPNNSKKDSENGERNELNGFASDCVDRGNGGVVAREITGDR